MKFKELKIIPEIQKALADEGYTEPTPIQAQAIPIALNKKDILGSAQTGTGKTAAFSIPIIQHLYNSQNRNHPKKHIRTLIVTPTRELAIQIEESISSYSKYTNINSVVIFGGVSQSKQVQKIKKGLDILIATPGRLLDLVGQGIISLSRIEYFVLDEADRMLDMGFIHDIKRILNIIPKKRQSLFFSATMPKSIIKLSNEILNNPSKVMVSPVSSTAEKIQQFLYKTNRATKKDLLLHILNNTKIDQALVFTRTKHGADRIVKFLKKKKYASAAIHGNKSQNQRQNALNDFKDKSIKLLVATDIAARGIDIDKLKYVINFDIPNESETYVHRIGRCGRANEEGTAISICEPEENVYIRDIEKLIKKKLEVISDNPFPQTDKAMTPDEKKMFEKEKRKKREEFFANRKAKKSQSKRKGKIKRRP